MFVVIQIFASMTGVGASASNVLMSMSGTLASFSPIYGIGLGVGMLVLFFSLAAMIAGSLRSHSIGSVDMEFTVRRTAEQYLFPLFS
jgi:hypothetical protein